MSLTAEPALVDLHCHLVPGVDDGAESVESALAALRSFRDSGVVWVVTTPHLDAGHVWTTRHERIETAFGRIAEAAAAELPELRFELAYEIRIDDPEVDLSDRSLGLSDGGAILVEFPQLALPAYSPRMLDIVRQQGWTPVLAHPERYSGIAVAYEWIRQWREMGVVMCMNVGSLLGEHGRDAQEVARRMLASGHADLIGSDHHARPHRSALLREGFDLLVERGGAETEKAARLLFETNPGAVLAGEALRPVPPLELEAGWLGRVRRKLWGG